MFKHEDCPGLKKLSQLRKACDGSARRYISILVGNGGYTCLRSCSRRRRNYDGICLSRDAGLRMFPVRGPAARKPKTCSTCTCLWCAMSSNPGLGLRCARKFFGGEAPFARYGACPGSKAGRR